MNMDEVRQTVVKVSLEALQLKELPTGKLAASLDSMQRLSLVVAVEDHFEICFDPEDEDGVETLEQVVELVFQKVHAGD